jgi:hypothetical protein
VFFDFFCKFFAEIVCNTINFSNFTGGWLTVGRYLPSQWTFTTKFVIMRGKPIKRGEPHGLPLSFI